MTVFSKRYHPPGTAPGTFADERERRPHGRIGVAGVGCVIDEVEHGAAQRLRTSDVRIELEDRERRGCEPGRSGRIDRPVRHQQGTRSGIEERPRETRESLGARLFAGDRVAG